MAKATYDKLELTKLTETQFEKLPRYVKKHINRLREDIEDLKNSLCTSFSRCKRCNHYYDNTYICRHCGFDNSTGEQL